MMRRDRFLLMMVGGLLAVLAAGCAGPRGTGGTVGVTPTPQPTPAHGRRYVVLQGDTLLRVATKFKVPYTAIIAANPGLESGQLIAGQTIIIPGEGPTPTPTPPVGTTPTPLPRPSITPTPGQTSPISAEARFAWPVQGEVIARFRQPVPWRGRMPNQGIDIRPGSGDMVAAAKSGRVNVFTNVAGFGKCVVLEHSDGTLSFYGHLDEIAVTHGTWVRQGDTLGTAGSTGDSSGVELHFRIMRGEQFVDPLPLLK